MSVDGSSQGRIPKGMPGRKTLKIQDHFLDVKCLFSDHDRPGLGPGVTGKLEKERP